MRSLKIVWAFVLIAVISIAAVALAAPPSQQQKAPPGQRIVPVAPGLPTSGPLIVHTPVPIVTMPLPAAPINGGRYVGGVPDGTKVPISRLPRLPMKTLANTATPKNYRTLRPMAASGAYIDITATNCGGSGSLGDQFNVGCQLAWQSLNNTNGDTKQDYYIFENNGNEFTSSATAAGGTYTGTAGNGHNTTMTNQGTYIFGTYDVTAGQWSSIIYVNAGQVFGIKVYQDPFHTQETYQFDASTSNNAYIYLQNVAQGDYYVVGVNRTGAAPQCVFMGPAPLPSPYSYPSNQLCNLTLSTGVQAPGGNLSVTWPITAGLSAGTYSVEVYDLTAGTRLGQVQVSVTGSSGLVLITKPDVSGPNANPSPNPAPAATAATVFDWDGAFPPDESVTGINASINGITNGVNYQWVMSDPQGQVIDITPAGTVSANSATATLTFDGLTGGAATMLSPGQYPANSFTLQFYDITHKNIVASQAFKVLGYSTLTQFNNAGTLGTSIIVPQGGGYGSTIMRFTNNGNGIFNGFGDNLREIEFSTGVDFTLSTTNSYGIYMGTSSAGACNTTCTTTATDSSGNTWNETITCPAGGLQKNGECNLLLTPASSSTTLAPNAYIQTPTLYFFSTSGAGCGNVCEGITSELPVNGVKWSNTGSALAWQPVYFGKNNASESGTAAFNLVGSWNQGTQNINGGPPFAASFVGTHFYRTNFNQADYNNNSPYSVPFGNNLATSNDDIFAYTISNTGNNTISELAIALPSLFLYQGFYAVDPASAGTWGPVGCPANFSSQWFCLAGGNIAKGTSTTIYIDQTITLQSFPYTDIQMQGYANSQWFAMTPASTGITTPDGLNSLDSLAMGVYSLIGTDMTFAANPSTIGQGSTANLGFQVTNTSTSVDPNPDSIDAIVIEAPSTGLSLSSTPSVSNAGWSYLGQFKLNGGTTTQYWFGLCASQFTNGAQQGAGSYGGPPNASAAPQTTPFTSPYKSIGTCSNETQSAGPGTKVTISNMQLTNFNTSGTQTWKMYAHGTNAGGWSQAQTTTITVTPESASIWFNQVNGTNVTSGSIPTIGGSPNSYQYAVKNTSGTSKISTINITLPGLDINNQNAYDGTNWWDIANITSGGVTITAPGGQADGTAGCTVNTNAAYTYNATSAGANGQIQVNCTNLNPNDTIYVNFTATNPQVQSDSYLFPTTVDGSNAGPAWLGSNEVTELFSLGLDVVVDPSNPGPGGSTPVVTCQNTCAFSGTTIDFGNIGNNTTYTFSNVVRTSIDYTGATSGGHTLDLYVSANQNPATTADPTAANELLSSVDSTNSTTGAGITFNQTTYNVVPTTNPGMLMATAPETYRSTPYDIIDNYEVTIGTEALSAHIITLTYTLIAN